jgi:hypothetical protein
VVVVGGPGGGGAVGEHLDRGGQGDLFGHPGWGLVAVDGPWLVQVDDRGDPDPGVLEQLDCAFDGERADVLDPGGASDCGSPRIVEGFPMRRPGRRPRCSRS